MNQDQDFTSLAMALIDQHNASVDDYNELCTQLDDAHAVIEQQRHNNQLLIEQAQNQLAQIKTLKDELALANQAVDQTNKVIKKADQIQAVSDKNFLLLKQAQAELKELNALNPKRLQKTVKEQKTKLNERAESITGLRKELAQYIKAEKQYKQELQRIELDARRATITGVYSKDGHSLMVWPYMERHQELDDNGALIREQKQYPLLYMNQKGKAVLLMHGPDNEVVYANSREIKPPQEILTFAKAWLNEAARNNWFITDAMLTMVN